jgi:non-homologous end joining protein Ku
MRGDNYLLALTTTTDEITGDVKPLFAFPVQVCKATEDKAVKFEVAAPSGAKREQKWLDPATGEIVTNDQCPRGIYVGDTFRPIDPEAIKAIEAENKITTMVAEGRRDLNGLREKYGDRISDRYFIQSPAKGGSATAYRLTYEALLADQQAIVVRRTKRTKQAVGFIYASAEDQCLVMCEVKFAAQMREPDEQVKQPLTVDVSQKQIEMARKVIAGMAEADTVLDTAADEADDAKRGLIEQALAGEAITAPTTIAAEVQQDDLEAVLAASLEAVGA